MIAGVGLTILGGSDVLLLLRGQAEPALLAVAELGRPGAIGNVHVTIRDFQPGNFTVIEQRNDTWTRVWVPLLKPDGTWPERPVVAYVTGVRNELELAGALNKATLTGVITNGIQGLGRAQQEKFAPGYPNVDLSDAIAFHVDRSFPSAIPTLSMTLGGLLLFIWGAGVTFNLIRLGKKAEAGEGGPRSTTRWIRIIAMPPGEAPPEIRKAWIGCVLPVFSTSSDARLKPQVGVLSRARVSGQHGYAVQVSDALHELEKLDGHVARWWRENTPDLVRPGKLFVFSADVCEPADEPTDFESVPTE
jgi:hypothetical protein